MKTAFIEDNTSGAFENWMNRTSRSAEANGALQVRPSDGRRTKKSSRGPKSAGVLLVKERALQIKAH
jgi:hypothetical protein